MANCAANEEQAQPREWFTAADLAEAALPGLPAGKRAISRLALDERWAERCDVNGVALARKRRGRGGSATEYHIGVLPEAARSELALRARAANDDSAGRADRWAWYDAQTGKVKAKAEARHAMVLAVEDMRAQGRTQTVAVAVIARQNGIAPASLWNHLSAIRGVARQDWLPALAPRHKGGGAVVEIDPALWQLFISDFLRPEQPTLAMCYERVSDIAKERGLSVPAERTMRRRLAKEVHPQIVKRLRQGEEDFVRSLPAQRRSVEQLHAMECVNIDGHKFDVWVMTPEGKKIRPILLGIQDVRSSKLLAWRVCEVESAHYVRLVFHDLFANVGIPEHCVFDNGRGFASVWITGKAAFKFRYRVKPEDPVGLAVKMGIQVHWALPYHGQSKPIERAWRDLTDRISRNAFVSGAYTGPNPMNKPENVGTRVMEWNEFVAHVDRQIAKHNAKLGRRGRDYRGRSFDDVFAASYAASAITQATPEQLRWAMLAAERKQLNGQTGELNLFGNRYYSHECSRYHGKRVTVRFDPGDLTKEVHLYDTDDAYLCSAQPWGDVQFLDAESARRTAKFVAENKRAVKKGKEALGLLNAAQVAAQEVGAPALQLPEPGATRIVRRQRGSATPKAAPEAEASSRIFAALGKLRLVE